MRRGHSLLEVLISLSLLSVLLTVLVQLFIQGTRTTSSLDREAEVGGLTQVALTRVARDLEGAALESVSFTEGVSFLTGDPWTVRPDGTGLEWRRYVLYWLDGGRLMRSESALGAPLLTPVALADPLSHRTDARVVARGATRFLVQASPDDPRTLAVSLALERRGYSFQLDSAVRVRN